MVQSANLGFPRIGAGRELKQVLELFWAGEIHEAELTERLRTLKHNHWNFQQSAGLDWVPVNDFSLYDHVLDTAVMVGAVPERYLACEKPLDVYFAMARGFQGRVKTGAKALDLQALPMRKWFDTNYHYIVPEFHRDQYFKLAAQGPVEEFLEAKQLGIKARPVILGPVSFLLLGKEGGGGSPLHLLARLLPVYEELLSKLHAVGAEWVQVDEPCLVLDLSREAKGAYEVAYRRLCPPAGLKIMLATYFGALEDNLELVMSLPVAGVHADLVRGPTQAERLFNTLPVGMTLSLGVVDGRNVWRTNLDQKLALIKRAITVVGSKRLQIAPSCSLLHVPVDLEMERGLDDEVKPWLAFAKQKVAEVVTLCRAINEGEAASAEEFGAVRSALQARAASTRSRNEKVRERISALKPDMYVREKEFAERREIQAKRLGFPILPTTTIGSFPQTKELRRARAVFKSGASSAAEYQSFLKKEIRKVVAFQEELGLDLLVHGEPERADMVEYFGERLDGFLFTSRGWVQSYGSRCVRPPIIFGDVSRPAPMTVEWATYAQSLTEKPVKGILTGPLTILQWSYVRDDQPRTETGRQIALALRDEVLDLEKAGIKVIQIDEPAVREGLPLRQREHFGYLKWAVDCFKLCSSGVRNETQIHTHMCYSDFNGIIEAISDMDADVISFETSRSKMELLEVFSKYSYPNQIGPGVYDIHSPRIPSADEMADLLRLALKVIPAENIWVNPDCGLKTRSWEEVRAALKEMVQAAAQVRAALSH
ncbi:MAG: 5-methyltetrahydropteroyltriglutamate--homocysteine S-methyltransferase [Deltaproteobacteria bacterium]|nr:5-methyltetrahydropteroyltriglutamate--homocysteine S-methyltransferase [Deltaproteobacteria bacterium]